ncbi:MAG: hypothetical protein RLZZ501_102 [Pseudomonadota bacterium]
MKVTGFKADIIEITILKARSVCRALSKTDPETLIKIIKEVMNVTINKRQAEIVMKKYKKIYTALTNITKSNFKFDKDMSGNDFAYVIPQDSTHTITIGKLFMDSNYKGIDSRVGTVIHEVSHFIDVLGTEDKAYGDDIEDLNLIDAMSNADTIERFAEMFK